MGFAILDSIRGAMGPRAGAVTGLAAETAAPKNSKQVFVYIGNNDVEISNIHGAGQNVFNYLNSGRDILYNETWMTVTSGASQQGVHGVPDTPLYIFNGALDATSNIADTEQLVDLYCDEGVAVEYEHNLVADHVGEKLLGTPGAYDWLAARFAGRWALAGPGACVRRDVLLVSPTKLILFYGLAALNDIASRLGINLGLSRREGERGIN